MLEHARGFGLVAQPHGDQAELAANVDQLRHPPFRFAIKVCRRRVAPQQVERIADRQEEPAAMCVAFDRGFDRSAEARFGRKVHTPVERQAVCRAAGGRQPAERGFVARVQGRASSKTAIASVNWKFAKWTSARYCNAGTQRGSSRSACSSADCAAGKS